MEWWEESSCFKRGREARNEQKRAVVSVQKKLGGKQKRYSELYIDWPGLFAADKLMVFLTWAILFVSLATYTAKTVV